MLETRPVHLLCGLLVALMLAITLVGVRKLAAALRGPGGPLPARVLFLGR
jgi:hypothetical protein